VVAQARLWLGTPYHHQGRRRGAACDCIGLILGVGRELGFKSLPSEKQMPPYTRIPHNHVAERTADGYLVTVEGANARSAKPGQIGIFYWRDKGHGQHFCIFGWDDSAGRKTMIHAYQKLGMRVHEAGFSEFWQRRLLKVYDYKELASA
jgi:NlpC/P60 family putative phage cell wall peptidase